MSIDKDCIVLFDMDGTLTEARQEASWSIVGPLKKLSSLADIGIVTGSPISYLLQQCAIIWSEIGSVSPDDMLLFPCNGTQKYLFSTQKKWEMQYSTKMKDFMGVEDYRQLIREIMSIQSWYADHNQELPLTGNFISDRQSMVNWCPVGRDADNICRKEFVDFDKSSNCREQLKEELEAALVEASLEDIVCTLGGNTSIDIYPKGWDKTYVLRHLSDYKKIYFVGDKCEGYGNDRALYEALVPEVTSFKTENPKNTAEIIEKIIGSI